MTSSGSIVFELLTSVDEYLLRNHIDGVNAIHGG